MPLLERLRLPVHRLQQPERVLRNPHGRPEERVAGPTWLWSPPTARRRRRPFAWLPPRRTPSSPSSASLNEVILPLMAEQGYSLPAAFQINRGAARMDSRLLRARDGAGADADQGSILTPLPQGAQQSLNFCSRELEGKDAFGPQFQRRHRPGTRRAAARITGVPAGRPPLRFRFRLPVLGPARVRRRTVHPA